MRKEELYYGLGLSQLETQEQHRMSYDRRASGLFSVAAALVGVAVIVLKDFTGTSSLSEPAIFFTAAVCVSFLVTFAYGVAVWMPGDWDGSPDLRELKNEWNNKEADEFAQWVGDGLSNAIVRNDTVIVQKAGRLKGMMLSLGPNPPKEGRRVSVLRHQEGAPAHLG